MVEDLTIKKLPDPKLSYRDPPPPEFGSREYIQKFGPLDRDQLMAYHAHMSSD